ncbi:MAG: hypothetical protein QNJ64_05060 [Crocosphaera sp.]|nr:hypothetical protein [Crocosphaera sp.]
MAKSFPPQSPVENLDYQSLSKMVLSYGNIQTIAIDGVTRVGKGSP